MSWTQTVIQFLQDYWVGIGFTAAFLSFFVLVRSLAKSAAPDNDIDRAYEDQLQVAWLEDIERNKKKRGKG